MNCILFAKMDQVLSLEKQNIKIILENWKKLLEKFWNFVSSGKWEPCNKLTCYCFVSDLLCYFAQANAVLGPVYTRRQLQHRDNAAMILVILFSLKSMVLQNGVATLFRMTPLFSLRTVLLASSQR